MERIDVSIKISIYVSSISVYIVFYLIHKTSLQIHILWIPHWK